VIDVYKQLSVEDEMLTRAPATGHLTDVALTSQRHVSLSRVSAACCTVFLNNRHDNAQTGSYTRNVVIINRLSSLDFAFPCYQPVNQSINDSEHGSGAESERKTERSRADQKSGERDPEVAERGAGVTEIDLSGERKSEILPLRSAQMLCNQCIRRLGTYFP